jgi:hypothetical protein
VCLDDLACQREDWIEEAQSKFEQLSDKTSHRKVIHELQSVFLAINNTQVTTYYSHTIRHEITAPNAITYLQEKHQWQKKTVTDILWQSHRNAISSLSGRRYKSITQLIHNWLPVNALYSKNSIGTARLCTYCSSCEEMQDHFLPCLHDELHQAWQNAAESVLRKLKAYDKHMDHHLLRLLSLAIINGEQRKHPRGLPFYVQNCMLYSTNNHQ